MARQRSDLKAYYTAESTIQRHLMGTALNELRLNFFNLINITFIFERFLREEKRELTF